MTEIGSSERSQQFSVRSSPAAVLELRWDGASDVGQQRAVNEDSLVAVAGLVAVADGLGGHSAGDVASAAAAQRLADKARARARRGGLLGPSEIAKALVRAADDIAQRTAGAAFGSGTTVSGLAVIEHHGVPALFVFNIGDSRVYRWRDGELRQITVDHSYVQELVDTGQLDAAAAEDHPDANIITRALGFGDVAPHDSWIVLPLPGDRYLACTDGLTREVPEDRLAALLGADSGLEEIAAALIDEANAAGGRDNITVGIVDVLEAPALPAEPVELPTEDDDAAVESSTA